MSTLELHLLRIIHVLGGIFWVGSATFTTLFLLPALAQSQANVGEVMEALRRRRLMTYLPVAALLTILSGLRLMSIVSSAYSGSYFQTAPGRAYALAGLAAIVAFVLGTFVGRPAAIRAAQLGRSLATATDSERSAIGLELAALRRRGTLASNAAVVLLGIGAAGMAVARYL